MNIRLEIGMTPEAKKICTAIVLQEYNPCLSDNRLSFWCYLDRVSIDAKIGKQSPEGRQIEKGIRNKISLLEMEDLLLSLVLPYITPDQFIGIITQVENAAVIRGKNAVRKALSVLLTEE